MLSIQHLRKSFGRTKALVDSDLRVETGEIVGLIGANGAGKSTLFRLLMGLEQADGGEFSWHGTLRTDWISVAKHHFGYVPENAELFSYLRVRDHLEAAAALKAVPPELTESRIERNIARFQLQPYVRHRVEECSKGIRQKVLIASALLHEPSLLLLDEPFSGLDVLAARDFQDLLLGLSGEGWSIVLSAHELPILEKLSSRIYLVRDHKLREVSDRELFRIEQNQISFVDACIHFLNHGNAH